MAIQVTCPGCLKRFNVSDKFAGKTGPCPSCQKTIKIPDKSEEVVIHSPDAAAPKDAKGRSILKPLRRQEVQLSLPVIVGSSVAVLVILVLAIGLGFSGSAPPAALLYFGSILLAVPLVFLGYWFLRDDELEGYRGKSLWLRCGLCSLAFALTWAIYAFVPPYLSGNASMAQNSGLDMVIFIPLMIILGMLASLAIFELEFLSAIMHYVFYFGVTFILAWLSGARLAEPLSGGAADPVVAPQIAPANPDGAQPATPPPAAAEPAKKAPNFMQ